MNIKNFLEREYLVPVTGGLIVLFLILQFFIGGDDRLLNDPIPQRISVPIYIRGDMNGWGLTDPLHSVKDDTEFQAIVELPPGKYAFKIGDENWKDIDLGGLEINQKIKIKEDLPLTILGADIWIISDEKAPYIFTLTGETTEAMKLTIEKGKFKEP